MKTYQTRAGVAIQPYVAMPWTKFSTLRVEHGRRYRLCQILPAVPQRLEWINEANIQAVG